MLLSRRKVRQCLLCLLLCRLGLGQGRLGLCKGWGVICLYPGFDCRFLLLRQGRFPGIRLGDGLIYGRLPFLHQCIQSPLGSCPSRLGFPDSRLQGLLLFAVPGDTGIEIVQLLLGLLKGSSCLIALLFCAENGCIVVFLRLIFCIGPLPGLGIALAPGILHRKLLLSHLLALLRDLFLQVVHIQAKQHIPRLDLLPF